MNFVCSAIPRFQYLALSICPSPLAPAHPLPLFVAFPSANILSFLSPAINPALIPFLHPCSIPRSSSLSMFYPHPLSLACPHKPCPHLILPSFLAIFHCLLSLAIYCTTCPHPPFFILLYASQLFSYPNLHPLSIISFPLPFHFLHYISSSIA